MSSVLYQQQATYTTTYFTTLNSTSHTSVRPRQRLYGHFLIITVQVQRKIRNRNGKLYWIVSSTRTLKVPIYENIKLMPMVDRMFRRIPSISLPTLRRIVTWNRKVV